MVTVVTVVLEVAGPVASMLQAGPPDREHTEGVGGDNTGERRGQSQTQLYSSNLYQGFAVNCWVDELL